MTKVRQYIQLAIIGFSFSVIMALPYIHFKLYDLITQTMKVSNQELGTFMTIFTLFAMMIYIPGGMLADKFKPTAIIAFGLFGEAIAHLILLVQMNYIGGMVSWAISGAMTGLYWVAMVKAIRQTGRDEDQAKMFGCFYGATGVFSTLIGFAGAKYVAMNPVNLVLAFEQLLYLQLFMCIVAAFAIVFIVRANPDAAFEMEAPLAMSFSVIREALTLPAVWIMTVLIFCGYGIYLCIGYLTPYTTNVLGASIAMGGVIGTIRAYGLRLFTGPLSGYAADKIGSTATILLGSFVFIAVTTILVLTLPEGTSNSVLVALTLLFGFVGLVIYTIMLSCLEETQVPKEKTGIAVAVISIIGYTPDALFPPAFGYLLDVYGNKGYTYIFAIAIILCCFGSLVCIKIIRDKKKHRVANSEDYSPISDLTPAS